MKNPGGFWGWISQKLPSLGAPLCGERKTRSSVQNLFILPQIHLDNRPCTCSRSIPALWVPVGPGTPQKTPLRWTRLQEVGKGKLRHGAGAADPSGVGKIPAPHHRGAVVATRPLLPALFWGMWVKVDGKSDGGGVTLATCSPPGTGPGSLERKNSPRTARPWPPLTRPLLGAGTPSLTKHPMGWGHREHPIAPRTKTSVPQFPHPARCSPHIPPVCLSPPRPYSWSLSRCSRHGAARGGLISWMPAALAVPGQHGPIGRTPAP